METKSFGGVWSVSVFFLEVLNELLGGQGSFGLDLTPEMGFLIEQLGVFSDTQTSISYHWAYGAYA